MNIENINKTIEIISKQEHTSPRAYHGFSMVDFTHNCGTASCIGGWAAALASGASNPENVDIRVSYSDDHKDSVEYKAQEFLGLSYHQGSQLFYPPNSAWTETEWEKITPKMACRVLEILRDEQIVDWPRAFREAEKEAKS